MYFFFKRVIGFFLSLIAVIILAPVMLIVAIAVRFDSKGEIIFKQQRIGKHGKPYYMYKFRTMISGAQKMGTGVYCFADDPRVTRVGKFLRKTSLDELPQLVNVLKGDMAIVGPRSPVYGHFPEYETLNDTYKKRFSITPGITGLAQVVGRNDFTWDEKVEYDNIYIDKVHKYGLFYDIKILFMTVGRVFCMNDVSEKVENTQINDNAFSNAVIKTSTENTEMIIK